MHYLELAISNIFFTAIPGFAGKFGEGVFNGISFGNTWNNICIPVKNARKYCLLVVLLVLYEKHM